MLQGLFRWPLAMVLVFTVAVAWFGLQSRNFEINASADTLISENNAEFIRSQRINQQFAPEEFLILAYRPHDGNIFSAQSQQDISEISARIQTFKRVKSVRSILNVPLLSQAGDALSADLDPGKLTQQQLQLTPQQLRDTFSGHPIFEGLLVNAQQTITGIQILFRDDPELTRLNRDMLTLREQALESELDEAQQANLAELEAQAAPIEKKLRETRNREIALLRDIIAEYESDADIFLGGVHVLAYQLINIIQQDLLVFGSAIALLIGVLVLLIFRRLSWLLITLSCCASSLLITLGSFALLGLKATVISANFVALQLILSLAIVIHLIVQYREEAAATPDASQRELVLRSLRRKLAPCFFAGFTTSVGFASLLLSEIEPVIAFGWMMVMAMAVTIAVTLLLFPALLLLCRREKPASAAALFRRPLYAALKLSQQRGGLLIVLAVVAMTLATVGALRLDVENSFINYFSSDTQVYQELRFIDREFGGSTPLDIIYTPPENNSGSDADLVLRAEDVQHTHRIQDALDALPAMGSTLSVVNFTQLAKQLNSDKPLTEYELSAVYWTLDEAIRKDLLGSFFIEEPTRLRISARIEDSRENLDRGQLLEEIHLTMAELGIPPEQYQLSNLFVLYQAMLEQLFSSQILTLGAVFLALTVAFCLVFRSLRVALVAIVPNILSAVGVLGIMGWAGIPLDFMTMTIAAIAMGIAVDDTIHYTHRYLQESQQQPTDKALATTHSNVGFALIYTTTIIALGFSLLAFSDFLPSVLFGLLTALAVVLALLLDLTLLPALLRRWAKPRRTT